MSDKPDQPLDFALQVRNNRWRLLVGLPSMNAAAAVVARVAGGPDTVKVAVEVYDPVKNAYERKDYLTFAGSPPAAGRAVFTPLGRELRRLPVTAKLAVAAVVLPVLGLALFGARALTVGGAGPLPVPAAQEVVIPLPSRALPREWVGAKEQKDVPWIFQGNWSADCSAARLDGGRLMTVGGRSLFGAPVNWVRAIGNRLLVNTGPDGDSMSTQIRTDGLVLFLEDRFTETVLPGAGRVPYTPEKPMILSKCL